VRRRSQPLAWGALMVSLSCGGQVVVDHDDRAEEEKFAELCVDYCELARKSSEEACQNYDWCLERCTGNVAEAKNGGCVEELLAWYDCATAVLEQGGYCDSTCHESLAYHQCIENHEGK